MGSCSNPDAASCPLGNFLLKLELIVDEIQMTCVASLMNNMEALLSISFDPRVYLAG